MFALALILKECCSWRHSRAGHGICLPECCTKAEQGQSVSCQGEWDTCISNELLKVFFAAAREIKTLPYCLSKNYKSTHGLMGDHTQLSMDIADFMLKSLE